MELTYYNDKVTLDQNAKNNECNILAFDKFIASSKEYLEDANINFPNITFFYKRNQRGESILGIQVIEGDNTDLNNYLVFDSLEGNIDMHASEKAASKAIELASLISEEVIHFFESVEKLIKKSGEERSTYNYMQVITLEKKNSNTFLKLLEKINKKRNKKD